MFSGYLSVPMVGCLIWVSVSRHSRYQKANKGMKRDRARPGGLSFRGKTLEDLNPIYTEQTIYDSILPGAVSFLICLQGVMWWEMAFRMGWYYSGDNLPDEVPHAEHAFLAQVIGDMFLACLILAFAQFAARIWDSADSSSHAKEDFEKEVHVHNML